MKFLLDSNIIIYITEGENEWLRRRMALVDEDDIVTSAIAYAEVAHGSHNGKPPPPEILAQFVSKVPVLPFNDLAALNYAAISFKRASFDRLIAAHALSLGLTVVTDNVSHFADVPGLKVENWTLE